MKQLHHDASLNRRIRLLAGACALAMGLFFSGCNTIQGAGEDIEAAGEEIEETAEDAT